MKAICKKDYYFSGINGIHIFEKDKEYFYITYYGGSKNIKLYKVYSEYDTSIEKNRHWINFRNHDPFSKKEKHNHVRIFEKIFYMESL